MNDETAAAWRRPPGEGVLIDLTGISLKALEGLGGSVLRRFLEQVLSETDDRQDAIAGFESGLF
ncbi:MULTISPECIES: FxSxx-COOH cyclophane-containing RiPP peptide [Thermomonospora]|uniref:Uncharacterized protein n=1 Tax=Thermomonospora curvata (strain ATCC 19995 / DSM 43183 / JCM 3096 / KCTC 9072 / NBRC 15933 / NCIMB 10081 / Henssen B9) TaxID=471852 RepID=D1A4U3_THECD|nr:MULTISPECIES: FxSxx-COOH cyclophane-containing RiPP peptide [Thermomonospora]ACY98112.1 hypothetical protein Tcur_2551 [Thermomonospora curvata DSM 43183]PKK14006.1 MAG: FXSXX-COOH protein [Thermomonospora sp. CIF 1]